jgi:signal transduction histidine kinase
VALSSKPLPNNSRQTLPGNSRKTGKPQLGSAGGTMDREQVARDIHDLIGQPLTALKLLLGRMALSPGANRAFLDEATVLIGETQVEVRRLIAKLQAEQAVEKTPRRK